MFPSVESRPNIPSRAWGFRLLAMTTRTCILFHSYTDASHFSKSCQVVFCNRVISLNHPAPNEVSPLLKVVGLYDRHYCVHFVDLDRLVVRCMNTHQRHLVLQFTSPISEESEDLVITNVQVMG